MSTWATSLGPRRQATTWFAPRWSRLPTNLALEFELDVFINDVRGPAIGYSFGPLNVAAGCTMIRLAMGDKLDIRAHSSSAAVPVTTSNDNFDWLTIARVH